MQVQLPFGRTTLTVDVPDTADVLLPGDVAPLSDAEASVYDALRQPIAGPPLRERVRPADDVVIVISDITRPVPNRLLLPPIVEELHAARVPDTRITILNGTGLHRANTPAELDEMLGPELPARYRIVQHVARDRSTLVEVGRVGGVPVEFAGAYVEASFRIVTGFVEPHLFAGWSGGAKGVMPGVAGGATIMANHGAENLSNPLARWCVTAGNPVFEQIQAAVALRPFEFLLNVTIDNERRLTGVFAGDMAPAHAAAIEHAERQYIMPVDREYDVVVVTNMGYPADTTLYQVVKAMSLAAVAVREGGAIVTVAGCEEGVGSADYIEGLKQAESPAALLERICNTEHPRHDQWQIQCQAMAQAKARVYLHSLLTDEQCRAAHLEPVDDVSGLVTSLVAEARAAGREGSVLVLPHGQMTVPLPSTLRQAQGRL
jgi:nickel-dependent lactate racemase